MHTPTFSKSTLAMAVSLAWCLGALPAHAATDADLAQLKQQIQDMRQQYESRLQALEQKLIQAEALTKAQADTAMPSPTPTAGSAPVSSNGFNPAISMVLSGTYARLSKDPATWQLPGFVTGEGELGPGRKGFNLGESEVSFSANVDPWWYGALTLALSPENEASVEEAFIQTTALSDGLKVKAGRFFSGVGYLNEQHAHTWDFVDAPLAYQAFLGGQLGQDGAQLKWLLPTDQFMELGAEVAQGSATDNGAGRVALFAHTGGDVGDSHSWRVGLSQLWQRGLDRPWQALNPQTGTEATNTFTGKDRTLVLDGVWKWSPHGNAKVTNFKLQGEYFRRQAKGQVLAGLDPADDSVVGQQEGYSSAQSGWYLQGIYQFAPGWRLGLRHDRLDQGSTHFGLNQDLIEPVDHNPQRSSVMLDWSLSEFSRWRVQLNSDQSRAGIKDTQFYLQYQMSLGAHGAHGF